jgi:TPR repeat protein
LNDLVAPFLKKAKEGDPYHQYLYAYVMGVHPDLSIDPQEKIEWYLKSAKGGFPPAQYAIALSLLYGQGCVADNAKAMEWLTRAAQADWAQAQVLLGRLLLKLPGNAEREKGLFWLKKAADNEYVQASMALAWIHATNSDEKLRNPVRALELAKPLYEDYPDRVTAFETMAAAYAGVGDFKSAVKFQKDALDEAKDLEWNLQKLQLRLDSYTNKKAWYETEKI